MVTTTKTRKTQSDYFRLPDEPRVELFDGEFFMVPWPSFPHQNAVVNLIAVLHAHVREHALGVLLPAPFDVVLGEHDVVQLDLLFIATEHRDRIEGCLRGLPDLLVEVISPFHAERDRIVKRDLYARCVVPEFWLVDPEPRTVEVLRLDGTAWKLIGIFQDKDRIESPCFPDLELVVESIFV